jgi:hypothetical protein
MIRFVRRPVVVLVAVLALLLPGTAASAASAATVAQKLAVLANWTQPTAASYDAWNTARLHRMGGTQSFS